MDPASSECSFPVVCHLYDTVLVIFGIHACGLIVKASGFVFHTYMVLYFNAMHTLHVFTLSLIASMYVTMSTDIIRCSESRG